MTNPSTPAGTKPSTWLEYVTKHKDSESLNKINNSVVDLFKVTTAEELSNNLCAKNIDGIMALKVSALLFQFPMENKMTLIH